MKEYRFVRECAGKCIPVFYALPPYPAIRLRANWAAVRQSMRASPPVIPASERESWAALCGVLGYPNRHTGVHPRHRLAGCRLGGRHDRQRKGARFILAYASQGPASSAGCRRKRAVCAIVPLCTAARTSTVSFPPPSGNPGWPYAGYCAAANRHTGVHPRYRLAGCRLGGRHDGAKGTRGGERAVRAPVHSFALSLVLLLCHSGLDPESRVAYAQYCVVSRLLSSSPSPRMDAGSAAGMTVQRGHAGKERAGKGVAPFCLAPRPPTLSFRA